MNANAIAVSQMMDGSGAAARCNQFSANLAVSAPENELCAMSQSLWIPTTLRSSSLFRKGGSLALVAAMHVLMFFAFTLLSPQVHRSLASPVQVVMLMQEPIDKAAPLPPPPQLAMPALELPREPIVEIAEPDSAQITVAPPQPTTPIATTYGESNTPRTVSSVDYIRKPVTQYPPAARALKQHGIVMLRALIDVDGRAREVNVHHSSGYRLLDEAARIAVLNALFKPYTENGRSLPVYVFIPIELRAG